jgi:hypothetical protein
MAGEYFSSKFTTLWLTGQKMRLTIDVPSFPDIYFYQDEDTDDVDGGKKGFLTLSFFSRVIEISKHKSYGGQY